MYTPEELALKDSLKNRTPILVVGAGFSRGAKVNNIKEIPMADRLTKDLFSIFFEGKSCPKELSSDDIEEISTYNLANICNNIQNSTDDRRTKLTDYLVKQFKNVMPDKANAFHSLITQYPWTKIYTLNIDDLIENIYAAKGINIIVQNEKFKKPCEPTEVQLIKLHGCVNRPELGFTFSADEYEDSIINASFKLQLFCNDYYDHDMIFLGTEFSEDDISILLKKYLNAGYRSNNHKYFYIAPTIKVKLKTAIKHSPNAFHIPWTAKQFLDECSSQQQEKELNDNLLKILKQYHFWDIREYSSVPQYFQSRLYYGSSPIWNDIFDNWDFLNSYSLQKLEDIIKRDENHVVAIYGKSFVGKSVIAKRLLVSLDKHGFSPYQFDFKSYDELRVFVEYIELLPPSTKIALLVEDAAMQYKNISILLDSLLPKNVERIIVISTSRKNYHEVKRHELFNQNFTEIEIKGNINFDIANEILQKLESKSRLGELTKYADNVTEQYRLVKSKNTIVNFLYFLTTGRGFEEFFKQKHDDLTNTPEHINLFNHICILSSLGIESYPKEFITALYKQIKKSEFLKNAYDVIDEIDDTGYLKLRCADFFETLVINNLESKSKVEILLATSLYLSELIDENTDDKWSNYFQKIAKVKVLINIVKIDHQDIDDFFMALEDKFKGISFYWMQRGILAQEQQDFESAEVFLKQAQAIRPSSYHIKHALAKNKMERALFENGSSVAVYYFEEGEKEILELINSQRYSKALCYSVHSYIELKLKYTIQRSVKDPKSLEKIADKLYCALTKAANINYDRYIKNARGQLYIFCKTNNIIKYKELLTPDKFSDYQNSEKEENIFVWE